MEYSVLIIYVLLVLQFLDKRGKDNKGESIHRGAKYYGIMGTIYLLIGNIGAISFGLLLKDTGIISTGLYWTGYIGFVLCVLLGIVFIFRMMTSTEP